MRKVDSLLSRAGLRLMPIWVALATGFLGVSSNGAPAAPPNDAFANAQVVAGSQGAVLGTNVSATFEPGEPIHFSGFNDNASVWYAWTAASAGPVTFYTTNASVVTDLSSRLDTVLAVYTGSSLANLVTVTNNDDINGDSAIKYSSVTFNATQGSTYYIAVDSWSPDTGYFQLRWSGSNTNTGGGEVNLGAFAGSFKFASSRTNGNFVTPVCYLAGEMEMLADIHSSVRYTLPTRATVTRVGGSRGRVLVDYVITNAWVTNILYTNLMTNIVVNPDGSTNMEMVVSNMTRYVNNDHGRMSYIYDPCPDTMPSFADPGWLRSTNVSTNLFVVKSTNYTSITNIIGGNTNIVTLTNIVGLTNIFLSTNVMVGAQSIEASAVDGVDYFSESGTLVFDDFQMSADIYPFVGIGGYFGFPVFGTVTLNPTVLIVLSNPRFDPLESLDLTTTNVVTDIAPPTLDPVYSVAGVNILNMTSPWGGNNCLATDKDTTTWPIINFQKCTYRVNNWIPEAVLYVERTGVEGCTVHYKIDWNGIDNTYHTWPTEAGSDYALPGTDFTLVEGDISWGKPDRDVKEIRIPILANPSVQFNRDIYVQLLKNNPDDPVFIGNINTTTLTVEYDYQWGGPQPAGAVDRTFNPDVHTRTSYAEKMSYELGTSYPPGNNSPGANKTVYAVATQPDGRAVIGGAFTALNGVPINRIARMQTNGWPDLSFNPGSGANDGVTAIAVDSDSKLVVGGLFSSINGINRYHIARLNGDGSVDSGFNPGIGADGTVWAVALQADGKILIGGEFTSVNGTNRNHIARLNQDGSLDTTFDPGTGPDGTVLAIAVENKGGIVIGGQFQNVGGVAMSSIARLNALGRVDRTFNVGAGGIDGPVYALVEQPDGQVVVGGAFSQINFQSRNNIARLRPTGILDDSFDPGSGTDGAVYSLALQPDGNILVGGMFTVYNQTRRVGIARLLPYGPVDTSFMDTAYNQFAGIPNHYANPAAYNPADVPSEQNTRNAVLSISLQPSGNVMIGGRFARVGGGLARDDIRNQANVARLVGGATPGPGNVEFTQTVYPINENAGQLFVSLTRTNGHLGPIWVTFATNTFAAGPGAASSSDFDVFGRYQLPYWDTWYPGPLVTQGSNSPVSFPHNDYGWQVADGMWGPNHTMLPGRYSSAYVYVNIRDNTLVDGNRTAGFSLLSPKGQDLFFLGGENIASSPALGRSKAVLQIVDNDFRAGEFAFASTNYIVNENEGTVTLTVVRTNGSTGAVTVDYVTSNGSATNKVDYVGTSGRLSFADGVTNQTIAVSIKDNTMVQPDRTFKVTLSTPSGMSTISTNAGASTVTIIDNDFLAGHLSFSISNFTVSEITTGAVVTVTRRGGGVGTLSVQYAVSDGTALRNLNYISDTNVLTWDSGETTSRTFFVPIIHDNQVTPDLTINLRLFNAIISGDASNSYNSGVLAGQITNAVVTIVNQDFPGSLEFSTANYNVMENAGTATITVFRKYGSAGSISVGYRTLDGTAISGTNFVSLTNRLSFEPGETSKTIPLTLLDDNMTNENRVLTLALYNPSPANLLSSPGLLTNAIVTVIDNETTHEPAGSVDPTYHIGEGFNNFILGIARQPDGKILAGGDFTFVNRAVRNRITRMNTDGTVDQSFQLNMAGADDTIRAIVSHTPDPATGVTNGPILVGGSFNSVNGVNRKGIARLYLDGSLDETFDPGSGVDNPIFAMAEIVQIAAGSFKRSAIIGGSFTHFNGIPRNGLARINDDGTLDYSFDIGTGVGGTNGTVFAIAQQSNGQILIGGDFTEFNGKTRLHLARLNADGTLDSTFNPNVGDSVRAITIQGDGKILIGGVFTKVNGQVLNHLARLNADGSLDAGFKVGVGANDTVLTLTLDSQGKILVGGEFTRASGVTRSRITQLNSDGTVDPGINFGYGADSFVSGIIVQDDGRIIVAGGFSKFNGLDIPHLARLFGGTMFNSGTLEFDAPTYSVAENGTNATVTVRRLGGTYDSASGSLAADFMTRDGNGIANVDYLGVTNRLVFPVGETFQSFVIPIIDNFLLDGTRTVNLYLTNYSVASAVGPQPSALLMMIDDECGITFSSADNRVMENVASGMARITVNRVGNSNSVVSVDVMTTTNGTAVAGVRYMATTNTLRFASGETNKYFYVPLINDNAVIGDQTVAMTFTNQIGALILEPRKSLLTIVEDDTAPGFVQFTMPYYIANENGGYASVAVSRTNGVTGPISVDFRTTNGSAIAGIKYLGTNGTLVFADGEISKTINIPVYDEIMTEGDQSFLVKLSNPQGGTAILGSNTVAVTIVDDDSGLGFSQPYFFVDELAGVAVVSVLRMGGSNGVLTVNYATLDGTARAGTNYSAVTNVLRFSEGETLKTFSVPLIHDGLVTGNQSFTVALSNPVNNGSNNVQLSAQSTASVIIVDGDNGFSFSTNAYLVAETGTNALVTVVRSGSVLRSNAVSFATSDGSASAGSKYFATNGVLMFAPGEVTKSFLVPIINETDVEGDTTVNVTLSGPTGGSKLVYPSTAVITVVDDDTGLSFSSPTYSVSECGVRATITVVRTGLTNEAVAVEYSTADGSGKAGMNYVAANGILEFEPGQRTNTFSVQMIDDSRILGDATVQLILANPTGGATIHYPLTATLKIVECDGTLVIPAGVALVSESSTPTNRMIDPGETVTVWFGLRSVSGTTTNLIATLLSTNGVTNVISAAQSYGALTQDGHSVSMPYTFTAVGTNGQRLLAAFRLQDGSRTNFEPVLFSFELGKSVTTVSNATPIVIRDNANANPYPSSIDVSGVQGIINGMSVTLSNVNHSYPSDINVMLSSPNGLKTVLMSHSGGGNPVSQVTLGFNDNASSRLPFGSQIVSGTNQPSVYPPINLVNDYIFTAPAPSGPLSTNLSSFNGIEANGRWSLFIVDDKGMNSGIVSNGWRLSFEMGAGIQTDADMETTVTTSDTAGVVSNAFTYAITVTNYGPGTATNVIISGALPSNATYLSGPVDRSNIVNGAWTYTIPALAMPKIVGSKVQYSGTSFNIVILPGVAGSATNFVSVVSSANDPNLANNEVVSVTPVDIASADLAVNIVESPSAVMIGDLLTYTIVVTNNGPSKASAVIMTNDLPQGGVLVTPLGGWDLTDNVITADLGDLDVNAQRTITLVVRSTLPGTVTNVVRVGSSSVDKLKANNFASSKTEVGDPPRVTLVRGVDGFTISWPVGGSFVLETTPSLAQPIKWVEVVTPAPAVANGQFVMPVTFGDSSKFFRLKLKSQ